MPLAVIDPGHGGRRKVGGSSPNNAQGPTGLLEKTVTLQLGLEARAALAAMGVSVLLTRDQDVNLGLEDRAAVAKQAKADAFVSIHLNDDDNPSVQGTETWAHTDASPASLRLAHCVQNAVEAATRYKDRGVKAKNLGVLKPAYHASETSACLIEVSFMSDPADEQKLKKPAYRARVGTAIAKAVVDYLRAAGKLPEGALVAAAKPKPEFEDATALAYR